MPLASLAVDLVVLAVVVLAAARGAREGGLALLVRLAAGVAGLLAGLLLTRVLSVSLSPVGHVLLGAVCVLGGLLLGAALGRRAARAVGGGHHVLDRVLGAAVRGGLAALVCGLVATLAAAFGPASWTAVLRDGALVPSSPAAVPVAGRVWSGVAGMVRSVAPDDLAALVPSTTLGAPAPATVAAVDEAAGDSVVRISARQGCGDGVVGTGFVAGASGLVVTNAHVVAGASSITAGGTAPATVVALDRRTDLAVLRVPGLAADPLPLASRDAANGSGLVVVGFPGGGPRTAVGAAVVNRMPVPNPGLSGGVALHQAYRLRATIRHGNSGSPLLDASGRVVGVVNALAGGDGTEGYAISVDELRPVLTAAATASAVALDPGACP